MHHLESFIVPRLRYTWSGPVAIRLHHPRLLLWMLVCAAWVGLPSGAKAGPAQSSPTAPWPPSVQKALDQAGLPAQALALWVAPVATDRTMLPLAAPAPLVQWQAERPVNPASLLKLVTSYAALDQLGPAWTWKTPVWLQGRLDADSGVLHGDLVIQGRGDPKLVQERLWLLLKRVQALGVREIRGDVVLDNSLFAPSAQHPADFDGEPWRPANVQSDALLFNYKSLILTFRPDPARRIARVSAEPAGLMPEINVPLASGPCQDWRGALKMQWQAPAPPRFTGHYLEACGELRWPLADPDPASYNARLLAAMWADMGGRLGGQVRAGPAPVTAPSFEFPSPALAEVLRDINKFSANTMAQQLLLSLPLAAAMPNTPSTTPPSTSASPQTPSQPVTEAQARQHLRQWLQARLGRDDFVLDNGSGLSRHTRLQAAQLGELLRQAYASPVMPELLASLPVAGLDGTLSRTDRLLGAARGRAHLKTGTLNDVMALAGYVLSSSGQRYVFVAVIHHDKAGQGRSVMDALLRWTADDLPAPNGSP